MVNCLVTKLKEVVQNDNLPHLNSFFITVTRDATAGASATHTFQLMSTLSGTDYKVVALDGGYFTVDSDATQRTSYTFQDTSTHNFIVPNADFRLEVYGKYTLSYVKFLQRSSAIKPLSMNIDDLMYDASLRQLDVNKSGSIGDLDKFDVKWSQCLIAHTNIGGTIDKLNYDASTISTGGANVSFYQCPNFGGRFENYAKACLERGYDAIPFTSPRLFYGVFFNNGVTFKGYKPDKNAGYNSIAYESESRIAAFNYTSNPPSGTIIEILVCGATQAEITAWQNQHIKVTDVDTGTVYPAL